MMIGRTAYPGAMTRDRYERLYDERLHQELAGIALRIDTERDEDALLQRRFALLHMWLARPRR
jgi:hypothetical protein